MNNKQTKNPSTRPSRRRGFSLLELMVALAVLAITSTIVGSTLQTVQDNTRDNAAIDSLRVLGRSAQANYALLDASPDRWQNAVVLAAGDVVAKGETGGAASPYTLKAWSIATARTAYADIPNRDVSYYYGASGGTELLGLAMVSGADHCVYAVLSPTRLIRSWSAGENTLANCNGAVAFEADSTTSIPVIEPVNAGAPNPVTLTVAATDALGANASETLTLSWVYDNTGAPTHYQVLRDGVEVADIAIASLTISPTDPVTWTDTTVDAASSYDYEVIAYRGSGASLVSSLDADSAITQPAPAAGVTLPNAAQSCSVVIGATTADISFTYNLGTSQYLIDTFTATLTPPTGVAKTVTVNRADVTLPGAVQLAATGLTSGITYTLNMSIVNSSGAALIPDAGAGNNCYNRSVTPVQAPAQVQWATPATVVADTSVTLTWQSVTATTASPVTGYYVYQLNPISGLYEIAATTDSSTTTKSLLSLTGGTQYSFKLEAYNDNQNGVLSAIESARPIAAPAAATLVTASRLDLVPSGPALALEWTTASSVSAPLAAEDLRDGNTSGIQVLIGADASNLTLVDTLAATATAYDFEGLTAGQSYVAVVRPFNNRNGEVTFTAPALSNSFTAIAAPAQVTGLVVAPTSASNTTLNLTWNEVTNTTASPRSAYGILKLNPISGLYEEIGTSADEDYQVTGLVAGTAYTFKVYAYGADLVGPQSSAVARSDQGPG